MLSQRQWLGLPDMVGQPPSGTRSVPPPSKREALRGVGDAAPYDGAIQFIGVYAPLPSVCFINAVKFDWRTYEIHIGSANSQA